jgi:hypothetical protein
MTSLQALYDAQQQLHDACINQKNTTAASTPHVCRSSY